MELARTFDAASVFIYVNLRAVLDDETMEDFLKKSYDLQKAKQDLYFVDIQLKIAEDTYKEYFTDEE